MTRTPLLTAAIGLALLGGCGDSAQDQALADVCTARNDIAKQVDQLAGLTLTTATTSEVSKILGTIRDDLSTVKDARASLSDERRQDVDAANQAFATTVQETASTMVKTTSIDDAKAQLEAAFDELAASYRGSYGTIDCA